MCTSLCLRYSSIKKESEEGGTLQAGVEMGAGTPSFRPGWDLGEMRKAELCKCGLGPHLLSLRYFAHHGYFGINFDFLKYCIISYLDY